MGYQIQIYDPGEEISKDKPDQPTRLLNEFLSHGGNDYKFEKRRFEGEQEFCYRGAAGFFVLSGEGKIIIDGKEDEISPWTTISIEPGTRHRVEAYGDEGIEVLFFFKSPLDTGDRQAV